jgi:hypothetical protein
VLETPASVESEDRHGAGRDSWESKEVFFSAKFYKFGVEIDVTFGAAVASGARDLFLLRASDIFAAVGNRALRR